MNTIYKIVLIGPKASGKSSISNFLCGHSDQINNQEIYKPTVGIRILEIEKLMNQKEINIELWDCSGDQSYEGCWPAVMKDANGIILIYSPDNANHEQEIGLWYEWFIQNPGFDMNTCLIIGNYINNNNNINQQKISNHIIPRGKLPKDVPVVTIYSDQTNILKNEFDNYLNQLINTTIKKENNKK